jgi:hypothetical protein
MTCVGSLPGSLVSQWADLYQLDVGSNYLTGPFPSEVGHLTNLRFLRAGVNLFSGTLPDSLSSLKELVLVEFQVLCHDVCQQALLCTKDLAVRVMIETLLMAV